jgi:hypothetical protein
MASVFNNFFSKEDVEYLHQLPEVVEAKNRLDAMNFGKIRFFIPLTETITFSLVQKFGLDLSNVSQIPMTWIKGDISPHVDVEANKFEKTYLAYLNYSPGELIVDGESYPIQENTAISFNEGLSHMTQNTGSVPRCLIGPMNEFVLPVGAYIQYYTTYEDAVAQGSNYIAYNAGNYIVGVVNGGSIENYTSWRIGYVYGGTIPGGVYYNGFDLGTLGISATFYLYPSTPCFLEGTKILCNFHDIDVYMSVEELKPGTLVKTSLDGYKRVAMIGRGCIMNPGNDERTENRLYKLSQSNYPGLKENLYITGCHSILVDEITEKQKEETTKCLGRIFVTDRKYRLPACVDELAEPWNSEGLYTIWHVALEHENERMNYGIYANGGLLVETCSISYLKNHSNMTVL